MKPFFYFRYSLPLFAALGSSLIGAEAADDSASSKKEAINLEDFVVSASPFARAQDEVTQPTSVLAGQKLQFKLQPSLGETLAEEPGISSTYFGPGASRPIIRGLGGDRIRVLTGGVGTMDASVVSPDHAVSLEPILIDRIEVVRGPASLLYGGAAVGGVVNVIDGRIPEELPENPVDGRFEVRLDSAADERTGAGLLTGAAGHFAWRIDGFHRETDDVKIPGLAPTPQKAAEMIAAGETPGNGVLPNSATESRGGSIGVSYIGQSGHLGVSYNGYDSLYGTVAEPDVHIDLRQRRWDIHGEMLQPIGLLRAIKLQAGIADYRHDELEGGALGTEFTNQGYEGRLEFLHEKIGGLEGAIGLQASRSDFAAVGEEAFLPPSVTHNNAAFFYEEAVVKPVTFQFGARVERQEITPDAGSGLPGRALTGTSLSAGAVWSLSDDYALTLSLTRNERLPNAQELYANGPHAGTGAFEIGDASLGSETSQGVDLGFRKREGPITGALTLFMNRFDGYIFEENTGAAEPDDNLPIYRFVQRDARFYGGELEVVFHLHKSREHEADLRVTSDYVRADNTTDDQPLPRMPPFRLGAAFDWRSGNFSVTAEVRHSADQDRIAPIETPTDGYTLVNLGGSYRFVGKRTETQLFARVTNLTDETARVSTSVLKDIAPLPGRDFTAGVRLAF